MRVNIPMPIPESLTSNIKIPSRDIFMLLSNVIDEINALATVVDVYCFGTCPFLNESLPMRESSKSSLKVPPTRLLNLWSFNV
jgi:hypothetical protein